MSIQNVSNLSMAGMVFSAVVSIVLPIVLVIYLAKKQKAKLSMFFTGCLTFAIVVLVLESLVTQALLSIPGFQVQSNIWIYALFGGLKAALFEETARFFVMKGTMKNKMSVSNAVMYGVGHGGIEAIVLVGLTSVTNLLSAIMINQGILEQSLKAVDSELAEQTIVAISVLWTTNGSQFFMSGVERIPAIALQILLSVWIYFSIKESKKSYLGLAFILHFVVDFGILVLANYTSVWLVEVILSVTVGIVAYCTIAFCKSHKDGEVCLQEGKGK